MGVSCKRRDKRFRQCSYILRCVPTVVATSRGSEHLPAELSVPCAIDRFDPGLVIPAVSAIEQILDGQFMRIEPCLLFGGLQILFDECRLCVLRGPGIGACSTPLQSARC